MPSRVLVNYHHGRDIRNVPPPQPLPRRPVEAASMATTIHPPEVLTPPLGVATSPVALPKRERLVSLDVFRGLTIAGMLLVNDPGSWSAIYPPLEHAEWNGWTPTDLIFPFFVFIVGITTHLSLAGRRARGDDEAAIRRQILRRGGMIFLLGFLMSGFPFFTWAAIPGTVDPSFLHRIGDRLLHWRILGVLQRIGIAYIVAALIAQRTTLRQQIVAIV